MLSSTKPAQAPSEPVPDDASVAPPSAASGAGGLELTPARAPLNSAVPGANAATPPLLATHCNTPSNESGTKW
ncbi:hypothetical protein [Endozoicomonas sp. ONNA2]|uniref:hypothetical protein n=1 Tax=Endozoicomonas sp. ONNA2 TaxID=2828741 RepID=UPI002148FDED|nr:hypothetical protein [Endozoicomonas sp. ONNA2]